MSDDFKKTPETPEIPKTIENSEPGRDADKIKRKPRNKVPRPNNGYYNSLIPEARGKAQTMLSQAEAYKVEQINRATGEAEKFLSILQEYQNNSMIYTQDTTKYRLLLETFEKILPNVKKYIVDSSDGSIDVKLFDPALAGGVGID
jgi:membrane protease subunit HflK